MKCVLWRGHGSAGGISHKCELVRFIPDERDYTATTSHHAARRG